MAISASQIVQINPALLKPGGKDLELNGLILSTNASIPTNVVLPFGDAEGVGEYFGSQSIEQQLATIYFLGYNNSHIKPRALFFYRMVKEVVPAWSRGSKNTAGIEQIKAITTGSLTLTMNGQTITVTPLDFSTITSLSDAATILQTALQSATITSGAKTKAAGTAFTACTVTYSSQFNAFIITSGESGANSTIEHASGDVATLLHLTQETGAILSQGADVTPIPDTMEGILKKTQNWSTFTTTWACDQQEVLEYATWANGKGIGYLFVYADSSPALLQPDSTSTIAYALKQANLGAVAGEFSSPIYAAFILSIIASIDYNRLNGTITTAFKSQEGLAANIESTTDAINLINQGMNFYGNYATRNEQFVFHYPGLMFGKYAYIDTYVNAIWFYNALQVSLMNGLRMAKRVPYTEIGYSLIRAWLQDPINRALKNGVIDPGVTLSESQKAEINREAGVDISGSIENTGYYAQILDPGAHVRITRGSATINLWYAYGGSIQRLEVAATALV